GGSWRGIKPKVAAEHGAVGCLIYSDPRDDGYRQGDVYPQGPWRPRDGVQRGSVADMPRYPGDPLTPGVGATPGAKRLPLAEAQTITKIPVLPISYGDAQPLLAALRGPMAPDAWRGALPLTYRIGPGPAKVHLRVKSDFNSRGYLLAAGSHALQRLVNDVARDIVDPETKLSVWKRAQLREIAETDSAERRREIRQAVDLRIDALGSGSDYTPFLQHA